MKTRNWACRPVALAGALALAGLLSGCKESSPTPPTPVVTQPPAPVRSQIANGNFTVGAFPDVAVTGLLTVSGGAGTVEIVADWTFATSDIDIQFYPGACSALQASRGQCTILAQTTAVATKPERLTIANVNPGTYTIGFANYANRSESGNFQVFFTPR